MMNRADAQTAPATRSLPAKVKTRHSAFGLVDPRIRLVAKESE